MKVVVIGGGTGLSTMLKGLKEFTSHITAIVTVSDNGGNSGLLRSELNIIPPGDIRNCLVSLANTEPIMKDLLQYRFKDGSLKGQNFGNLLLAALTDLNEGNFNNAIQITSKVLAITGKVLPVTLAKVNLHATFSDNHEVIGETEIVEYGKQTQSLIKKIVLKPEDVQPTPDVLNAIENADLIILGPGSLYTSIISNLLVKNLSNAIATSPAKKVYIANLMSQPGETTGLSIESHVKELEKYIGAQVIDAVIISSTKIKKKYIKKYAEEGAHLLRYNKRDKLWKRITMIEADITRINETEGYIRHNSVELAQCIFEYGG
ncbi:hypothetical protein AN643_01975 [Candidatus Epulonipiscioides saccharophilum]|nr:hypothetical protein AN643_01975 [Epulopiscium sp. SCG-B10WGA-EpuloB]